MKTALLLLLLQLSPHLNAQKDIDRLVKGGELLLSGLTIFKVARSSDKKDSKVVESLCVKNKLAQKVTFRIKGTDTEDNEVAKEVVVQKDGKECIFGIPKGIYDYEIVLATNEVYRKGEYKFEEEEVIFTVKDP